MCPATLFRSFPLALLLATPLLAADAVPSAVRARQLNGPTRFRTVQDETPRTYADDDESGPVLGQPAPFQSDAPDSDDTGSPAASSPDSAGPGFSNQPLTPIPGGTPGVAAPGTVIPGVSAVGAPEASLDFWIVSSRNCPQQGTQPCMTCGMGYFRCNRSGRPARSDEATFQQSLPPGVPVCIVVHGSFTDWETVCEDACATHRWLKNAAPHLPLRMVFYSWPSDPATVVLPPLDVEIMGTRAAFNGMYLSQLVQRIPQESPVCLMGHSHGARAISACLHLLGGGDVQGYRYQNPRAIAHRIRAVYLAGAVDHHWLMPGERYGQALCRTEALLNVRNSQDLALGFYSWRGPMAGTAIGREGFTNFDYRSLGQATTRIRDVDVAPLLGTEHLWPGFVRRPEIATAAVPYVYFTEEPTPANAPGVIGPSTPGMMPADQARRPWPSGTPYARRFQPVPPPGRVPANGSGSQPAQGPMQAQGGTPQPNSNRMFSPSGSSTMAGAARPATPSTPANASNRSAPATTPYSPYGSRPSYAPTVFPRSPAHTTPAGRPPATLGAPETSSSQAAPPLGGRNVTRTLSPPSNLGGSLQPIERPQAITPRAPVNVEPDLPAVEPTQPVHIDEKPFQRPRSPLPSILRRYYPEASRDGLDPST